MIINYDSKNDLLYIRIDKRKNTIINKRMSDNVVLELGKDDMIIGIEIMDASKHVNLEEILPVTYKVPKAS
ncbi:MAG: DUF2283 domain-containing protein [Bacteroidales bacterium]